MVGAKSSGKTVALAQLLDAVRNNASGYTPDLFENPMPMTINTEDMIDQGRLLNVNLPGGTIDALEARYGLNVSVPLNGVAPTSEEFAILDVPGEIFRRSGTGKTSDLDNQSPESIAAREEYESWIEESVGIVFFVPATGFANNALFTMPRQELSAILKAKDEGKCPNLERLIIAITMFDVLLLHLGDIALDVAIRPDSVKEILKLCLRRVKLQAQDMMSKAGFNQLEIKITPISAFGFNREFGCANVDPNELEKDQSGIRMKHQHNGETLPYLVGDPFLWAAFEHETPFMFDLKEIVG